MEKKLEEVERDYIEFRKEMEEEEHIKSERCLLEKQPGLRFANEWTDRNAPFHSFFWAKTANFDKLNKRLHYWEKRNGKYSKKNGLD